MPKFSVTARVALWITSVAGASAAMVLSAAFLYLSPDLPSVDVLRDIRLQTPLRVYSADGALIGEFGEKRRTPVAFDQVPPLFFNAILAAEDHDFYRHHGVDFSGLLRAASQLVTSGRIQTGGSTITMQVARNYFLSHARTFSRKFNEILLALQIERELSKEQILELYVNKIFLGNRAYGIEAAAEVYYGKHIGELNPAQLAMIAGLPKAPSAYNPLANPARAIERRNWILGRMLNLGYIDQATYQEAVNSPVTARYHGTVVDLEAGYAAEMVRQEMLRRYGSAAYTEGYVAYTTLKSGLQHAAQKAVIDGLLAYDQRHGYRGPERKLAIDDTPERSEWLAQLREIPGYGGLVPAVVSTVAGKSFTALLYDGTEVSIEWEQGLSDARRYINVNARGSKPEKASDVVAVGDVVRLQDQGEGIWQLRQMPAAQAALVSLDAQNGAILSLVGGFDFQYSKFNRITQAQRQPGSAFKPFLYTAALANGFTPASIVNDAPVVFSDNQLESMWRPTNSGGKFYGPTRLRRGLYLSRNLVSIRLLQSLGIETTSNYIQRFGFDRERLPKDLSLALGSHAVTPLTLAGAYGTLANGGYRVEPYLLARIEDLSGNVLFEANPATVCRDCPEQETSSDSKADSDNGTAPPISLEEAENATMADILNHRSNHPPEQDEQPHQDGEAALQHEAPRAPRVVDPQVAFIIDSMLRDVIQRGTGRRARELKRSDLAGKTGTTNGPTDAWFSGYGGGIVATAWVGFDQYEQLGRREYGGTAALPIWVDYMRVALSGREEQRQRQPEGVVTVRIDPTTGLRARPGQPDAIFEYFREENVPAQMVPEAPTEFDGSNSIGLGEDDIF